MCLLEGRCNLKMKCPPSFKLFCLDCKKGYEFGIDGYKLHETLIGSYEDYKELNLDKKDKPICDDCYEEYFDLFLLQNDEFFKHRYNNNEVLKAKNPNFDIENVKVKSPFELYGNELEELYNMILDYLTK